MQPSAMCFSVMVRTHDSQTGHSVTQLAAEVEDCLGPRNTYLKTWRESAISSKHHKTLTARESDVFSAQEAPTVTMTEERLCFVVNNTYIVFSFK